LTEAREMSYYDASYELARAHIWLFEWYNSSGGEEVSRTLKEKRSSALKTKETSKNDESDMRSVED
jgi:hypothetical protein